MKKFTIVLMVILLLVNGISFAKERPEKKKEEKKNYLKAVVGAFGVNAGLWYYDFHFKDRYWARISFGSIAQNFKKGFRWDNNGFQCNQWNHAFHGALFYQWAKIGNLSFYESFNLAFWNSFVWEMVLETHRPSTNDQIFTPCGGAAVGEVWARITELIIDESSTGIERLSREALTLFFNPVFGVDRLITGRAWKRGSISENHYYDLRMPVALSNHKLLIDMNVEYKDAIEKTRSRINPYDYFRLDLRARYNWKKLKIERVLTSGIVFGKRVKILSSNDGLIGLFMDFDYINTSSIPLYKISTLGMGPGLAVNFDLGSDIFCNTFSVFSAIFGGSSSSVVLKYGEKVYCRFGTQRGDKQRHPYYLGPGISFKTSLEFGKKDLGSIYADIQQHWVHSIFVPNANEYVTRLIFRTNCDIVRWAQVRFEYEFCSRKGTHQDYPPLKNKSGIFRIFYVFRF